MKKLGIGNKRLQNNIVDLFPGIPTNPDSRSLVNGRKHTDMHTCSNCNVPC